MENALERITMKKGGLPNQHKDKIHFDHKSGKIIHRYASVPIFDKFDYEKKLEEAINHDYLHDENVYDYYLFRNHSPKPPKSSSQAKQTVLGQQSGWHGTPEEQAKLKKIIEMEKTNFQWHAHIKCFLCLVAMVMVTLLRGSKNLESIVGIKRCSGPDWVVLCLFIISCSGILYAGLRDVKAE